MFLDVAKTPEQKLPNRVLRRLHRELQHRIRRAQSGAGKETSIKWWEHAVYHGDDCIAFVSGVVVEFTPDVETLLSSEDRRCAKGLAEAVAQ